jgi:hypothetical protein
VTTGAAARAPGAAVWRAGAMVSAAKEERSPGGVRGALSRRVNVVDNWAVTEGLGPVVLHIRGDQRGGARGSLCAGERSGG